MLLFKFQELNLQSIRRELIFVLEEFEKTGCLNCYSLKGCKCPEPSDKLSERTEEIPEASANILHQESERTNTKSFNYGETLVHRLLRDQEAYPDAASELVKVNTAQRIYHSARLKTFKKMTLESMLESSTSSVPHPQMVYTTPPPARTLPQPIWVGLNWRQRHVPFMMPGIPGVPVRPTMPAQAWPTNLRSMPTTPTGLPYTPQVQTPDSPVNAFFRRFQSPLGSFGTSGSFETSESAERSSGDQIVPCESEGTERLSR